jgi:hypothetical protein
MYILEKHNAIKFPIFLFLKKRDNICLPNI